MSEIELQEFVENETAAQDDLLELIHEILLAPYRMGESE
jgi:hypothetical protein